MSLVFGGLQYLLFAAIMFYLIGRIASFRSVRKLFWYSPFVYVLCAILGTYALEFSKFVYENPIDSALDVAGFYFVFGLLFGYIYCVIIEVIFQVFKTKGWVFTGDRNLN